ncbi:MAG: transposase [Colwellia sp.]|nr:transposase [Colwellia sp.]
MLPDDPTGFKLPVRQTEVFMCSVVGIMGLDLSIPDYNCISKRCIDLNSRG